MGLEKAKGQKGELLKLSRKRGPFCCLTEAGNVNWGQRKVSVFTGPLSSSRAASVRGRGNERRTHASACSAVLSAWCMGGGELLGRCEALVNQRCVSEMLLCVLLLISGMKFYRNRVNRVNVVDF